MSKQQLNLRVTKRTRETEKIAKFELAHPNGDGLPQFKAGAHLQINIPNGLTRQYSICNSPITKDKYEIAVYLDEHSRGGSAWMHQLKVGDDIQTEYPINRFEYQSGARSVFLAGGIGITPLLSMAEQAILDGSRFQFYVCTRTFEETPFKERLKEIAVIGDVHYRHSSVPASARIDFKEVLAKVEKDAHIYICGPRGFINDAIEAGTHFGYSENQIHYERFSNSVESYTNSNSNASEFSIDLRKSNRQFIVRSDETIAAVLVRAGMEIPLSCEQGVCGTCATRVLAGLPDHRDEYLTKNEKLKNNVMMICCSRSLGPQLILDL